MDKISEDSECDKSTMLQRFRGNLIVRGGAPFEETRWKSVQIGNCLFEVLVFNITKESLLYIVFD